MRKIFIKILAVISVTTILCPDSTRIAHAQVGTNGIYYPPAGESLDKQSLKLPTEAGLSSSTISELQSVITSGRWALWRHGYLVHVEGDFNIKSDIGAASNGIHSATVGVAIERNLISSLNEKLSLWNSELTGIDTDVTWYQVLNQTSALDDPVVLPGSVWADSDANTYQLNQALSRVWGRTDLTDNYNAVLADALLDPIDAQGWSSSVAVDGIHLHMDLEDMGRIGTLLIAGGIWVNNRIIPEWVIDLMVTRQSDDVPPDYNNTNGGNTGLNVDDFPESPYGLMTWVNTDKKLYPEADASWNVSLANTGHIIAMNQTTGIVLAVEDGAFTQVADNPPGWPTSIRSAIETVQQNVVEANPLVAISDYNVSAGNNIVKVFPGASWEIKQPEELGMSSARLDSFRATVGGNGSGIVIKDGYQIYSWGNQTEHRGWASASKAMFSTLMFFAINEGILDSVDDLIVDQGWALDVPDQAMTFRHLANMSSGYTLPEGPGTNWAYNDYGVNLFALTILDKVFGIDSSSNAEIDALVASANKLGPLQFEDGSLFSSNHRVTMTPRDYARVGWFWANRGQWDEQVILPQTYFDNYMQVDVPDTLPGTQGGIPNDYLGIGSYGGGNNQSLLGPGKFGFMWWFNTAGQTWPDAPIDTFQVNGHWNSEVMTIIPSLGIVAAWLGGSGYNSDTFNIPMNATLNELVGAVTVATPSPTRWGAPSIPLNALAIRGDGLINLSWDSNPEADIVGYRVYRSTVSGGTYVSISELISDNSYLDNGLQNGAQYYYVVVAEDIAGQLSQASMVVTAIPNAPSLSIAHWRLNEGSGVNAFDTAGTSDGTVAGATWVPGVSESALDLDGVSDHVVMLNTPELDSTGTQLTLSAWLYPHDGGSSGGSRIISKRTDSGGSDVYAMYTQNYKLWFRIDGQDMASDYSFTPNQWLHVTMVYDGMDKRIYINGISDTASPQPKTDLIDSSTRQLHLGTREGEGRYFNGLLDDIRIYNTALTAAEIASMDQDTDNLTDYLEVSIGTDFILPDTDGDGLMDGDEVLLHGTEPLLDDTDLDGYTDGLEITIGTDPLDDQSTFRDVAGDINGDGLVNAGDLVLGTRILTGTYSPTASEQARFDIAPLSSGLPMPDGNINLGDQLILLRLVLGVTSF